MKKTIFFTLILTLLLTACGGNTEPTTGTDNGTQSDPNSQDLPLATKLAVGTLKLEGTELAVAPDQAANLLPLWQVFNNLSSSDTAAPEEITAITAQIQETMTPEQMQAIEGMGLTNQDIFASMQELGISNAPRTEHHKLATVSAADRDPAVILPVALLQEAPMEAVARVVAVLVVAARVYPRTKSLPRRPVVLKMAAQALAIAR